MIKNQSILIDGINFFADSEDPAVYYYLPATPKLALVSEQPQLMLYAYRGVNNDGGYLSVQTNLRVSQHKLTQAAQQLPDATLLPFPVINGQATMNVLGLSDTQDISLMGNNTAIFHQALNQQQSKLLIGALKQPCAVPLAVVYELDFIAQRAPSNYSLEAHWDQVQHYISTTYGVDFFFVSANISHISETLISNKTVKIVSTNIDANMAAATQQLTTMLLSAFFKPVFSEPDAAEPSKPATLGFYFQQVDLQQLDQRYLYFDMRQESVVRQKKYLSATLASMGCKQVKPSECITTIDANSPFFMQRKLTICAGIDFAKNAINYIVLTCHYGEGSDNRQQHILHPNQQQVTFSWPSQVSNNTMARKVSYSYQVFFDSDAVAAGRRPSKITSKPFTTEWDYVQIIPSSCYQLVPVSLMASPTLQWDWYSSVQILLKYQYSVAQDHIEVNHTIKLCQGTAQKNWEIFVPQGQAGQFQYQLAYQPKSGLPHLPLKTDWQTATNRVYFSNAFAHQRQAHLLPEFQWHKTANVERIEVRLSYRYNGPNSNALQQLFSFTEDCSQAHTFSADQADTQYQTLSYIQTVFFADGSSRTEPPQYTESNFIALFYPPRKQANTPHPKGRRGHNNRLDINKER